MMAEAAAKAMVAVAVEMVSNVVGAVAPKSVDKGEL